MRLEQLKYYVEVVNSGSISRASRILYVSQPAISCAIKEMESELGKCLLIRNSQGVAPTEPGSVIYRDCREILETINSWYSIDKDDEPKGAVDLMALPAVCQYLTSRLLLSFEEKYPKLNVHIHDTRPQNVVLDMKHGNANVAITTISIGNSNILEQISEMNWQYHHIFDDERYLFMSNSSRFASKLSLTQEDLKDLMLVYYSLPGDVISSTYECYFKSAYRVATKSDVLELVCNDRAVFIQPYRLNMKDYRMMNGQLVAKRIPIRSINHKAPVYLIHVNYLKKNEQLLVDYILDSFLDGLE